MRMSGISWLGRMIRLGYKRETGPRIMRKGISLVDFLMRTGQGHTRARQHISKNAWTV